MTEHKESPGHKAETTNGKIQLSSAEEIAPTLANGKYSAETSYSKQTSSAAGTQTELRSLRDAIRGAINAIEEKAPHAPIERELVILDRVADELGNMMCEDESGRER
jgi:hypothetical protein